jgi:hypothetical protein
VLGQAARQRLHVVEQLLRVQFKLVGARDELG